MSENKRVVVVVGGSVPAFKSFYEELVNVEQLMPVFKQAIEVSTLVLDPPASDLMAIVSDPQNDVRMLFVNYAPVDPNREEDPYKRFCRELARNASPSCPVVEIILPVQPLTQEFQRILVEKLFG